MRFMRSMIKVQHSSFFESRLPSSVANKVCCNDVSQEVAIGAVFHIFLISRIIARVIRDILLAFAITVAVARQVFVLFASGRK